MADEKINQRHDDEVTGKAYDARLMKRLLKYAKPYSKWLVLSVVLTVGVALASTIRPYLTKVAIDDYVINKNSQGLLYIVLLLFGTLVVQGIVQYTMMYLTQWIGQKVILDLRMELFKHVQKLSMRFFDKNPVGTVVTRLTNDIEVLNEMFSSGIVMIFADVFIISGILFFMFSLSWKLTLICLSVVIPLIYVTIIFRKKVRAAYRDVRYFLTRMNTFLQEHISGIMVVKIFNKEKRTIGEFEKINYEHTRANKKSVLYYSVFFPIVELIGATSAALIIWYGGGEVIQSALTIGILISFIQYGEMFFRPIRDLSEKYNILQTAMASSERIFKLLDRKEYILDSENPIKHDVVKGDLEFKDVSFAYVKEDYVLKNVSFRINEGDKIAIVGATGSGKSTIINLLCRFYDINSGEISIDGINIKDISQQQLRRNIGLVVQDIFLFSDSVANNISMNNDEIDREKIKRACEIIGIKNFIEQLPLSYEQQVKERGITLSQGQRQLITFARALAYDPRILILDEATSSVDTHSEILIQNAIDKLMEGRTSIIIAHRLSTIQKCDKIIVMHKGEIRESGTHYELLAQGGIYSKLYQLQYKESLMTE